MKQTPLKSPVFGTVYRNVWDGSVWKSFCQLAKPNTLGSFKFFADANVLDVGLMINCDAFQPFKIEYSVTVVLAVIMNLPIEIRNRPENILLLCVFPGPSEPTEELMTHFTRPLVDEFEKFYHGVDLEIANLGVRKVWCLCMCVSCDAPGLRRFLGFCGHASRSHGCHKCKNHSSERDKTDCPDRTVEEHRRFGQENITQKNSTKQKEHAKKNGYKYTPFFDLDYFDTVVRGHFVIDMDVVVERVVDLFHLPVFLSLLFSSLLTADDVLYYAYFYFVSMR